MSNHKDEQTTQGGPTEELSSDNKHHEDVETTQSGRNDEQSNDKKHYDDIDSFEDMNLDMNLLHGICAFGFEKPSSVQQKAIMPMVDHNDMVVQAQSGKGKTGTFVISTLQKIALRQKENPKTKGVHAIILSHTRELARQTKRIVEEIAQFLKVKVVLCVGETNKFASAEEIYYSQEPVIAVGTVGRIKDMINSKFRRRRDRNKSWNAERNEKPKKEPKGPLLPVDTLHTLVLDEADKLLEGKFKMDIQDIYFSINDRNNKFRVCVFSATMPNFILDETDRFMDPIRILVKKEELTLEGIKQHYINVEKESWKYETFCDLFSFISIAQSIVYVNEIQRAEKLYKKLSEDNYTVGMIHGRMPSEERIEIVKKFRTGDVRMLISTDLLARGFDVQQVSLVINYDLPRIPSGLEDYIHRIGRSGRFGRKGHAINFVTNEDIQYIRFIEEFYSTEIEEFRDPELLSFS